jgi:hypothetical protein
LTVLGVSNFIEVVEGAKHPARAAKKERRQILPAGAFKESCVNRTTAQKQARGGRIPSACYAAHPAREGSPKGEGLARMGPMPRSAIL